MTKLKVKTDRRFTWDEYLNRVESRLKADHSKCWGRSSTSDRDEEWAGTKDLPSAIALARNGWPEGAARIQQNIEHAADGDLPSLFPARDYDLGGEYPDVTAYCAGQPDYMVSHGEANTGISPVVRLGINGGANCSLSAEALSRFGAAVLSHAAAFQRAGYSVALDWLKLGSDGMAAGKTKGLHLTRVEILTAGAVLDVDRVAFMLAHPAMLRRFWFADIEMVDRAKGMQFEYGFSKPVSAAPAGWYEGIALPKIEEFPGNEHEASTEDFAKWLGEFLDRALHGEQQQAA